MLAQPPILSDNREGCVSQRFWHCPFDLQQIYHPDRRICLVHRIFADIRIQIELVAVADPSPSTGTARPKGYQPLPREARHLAEASIGHGLSANALIYGMAARVERFRAACTLRSIGPSLKVRGSCASRK